ncbi:MAG: 3-oxoacyl-[acyl-carrier-protein] reductase [Bacteroidales bacterium]|jgi:3-oxoacyl-[acyl-carrier protein] reductase|nr:3-oxoacyl-[acyl-carrier-protein] reductase [Bacteroidales bacterium]
MELEGKIILVTGGTRGIGKEIALECAKEGAIVCFTALHKNENFLNLEKELEKFGNRFKSFAVDASIYEDSVKVIDEIISDFDRVDILINNAGITDDTLLIRMSENQWDKVINTNLKSVFNYTKAVQKTMLKQRSGSIINISSVVGKMGNAGQSNYAASKAGIIGFTKSIAKELGSRNIRCNAIAPGFIETDMTDEISEEIKNAMLNQIPLRKFGKTKDVADLVVFLASDKSTYITGQVINVCGGMNI